MSVLWNLPIRVYSEPNIHQHWGQKYQRYRSQKRFIWAKFFNEKPKLELPVIVELTRHGPRELDFDNLVASFKAIRDEVANQLIPGLKAGQADSSDKIFWRYYQKKDKDYSIDIKIESI